MRMFVACCLWVCALSSGVVSENLGLLRPIDGFSRNSSADVVMQTFRCPDRVSTQCQHMLDCRENLGEASLSDVRALRRQLTNLRKNHSSERFLRELILASGTTKNRLLIGDLKAILAEVALRPNHQDAHWALAEIGDNPKFHLRSLSSTVLASRIGAEDRFHCLKLLLFSSRPESNVELNRINDARPFDGAYAEEVNSYKNYRDKLLQAHERALAPEKPYPGGWVRGTTTIRSFWGHKD